MCLREQQHFLQAEYTTTLKTATPLMFIQFLHMDIYKILQKFLLVQKYVIMPII